MVVNRSDCVCVDFRIPTPPPPPGAPHICPQLRSDVGVWGGQEDLWSSSAVARRSDIAVEGRGAGSVQKANSKNGVGNRSSRSRRRREKCDGAITFDGDMRVIAQLPSLRGAPPREVPIYLLVAWSAISSRSTRRPMPAYRIEVLWTSKFSSTRFLVLDRDNDSRC